MNTANVRWSRWGSGGFDEARQRDIPVFLLIGYVGCRQCDRMVTESLVDPDIVGLLNDRFVSILVDRDERPDIDAAYMSVLHTAAGRGGWPLVAVLDHDERPIWIGSYLDQTQLAEMLNKVSEAWMNARADLLSHAENTTKRTRDAVSIKPARDVPSLDELNPVVTKVASAFDAEWGGFGAPPKFTMPSHLSMITRAALNTGADVAQQVVRTSIDAIAAGGIYDQIGGGFLRYSTDREWLVPRFEKMTIDQALLVGVYREAFALWRDPLYRRVIEETLDYVTSTLLLPGGGFAHAQAGDSPGPDGAIHDGILYTWTPEEWRIIFANATIGEVPVDIVAALDWFDITDEGHLDGRSIPNRRNHRDDQMRTPEMAAIRNAVASVRARRPAPRLNELVVVESTAAMTSVLASCAILFRRDDWRALAISTGEFLVENLQTEAGWLHCWKHGHADIAVGAFPSDYTELIAALLSLAEITGEARWVATAQSAADELLDRFFDPVDGGLWHTPEFEPEPVIRLKQIEDRQSRSPNAMAATLLTRLAAITGELRYRHHAERILQLLGGALTQRGPGMPNTLAAVDEFRRGVRLVVIVPPDPDDPTGDAETSRMARLVLTLRRPHLALVWGERFDSPVWDAVDAPGAYLVDDGEATGPFSSVEELFERITGQPVPDGQKIEV